MNVNVTPPHRLICVAPALMARIWPLVRDMIDEGYAACGELTPTELFEWLCEKKHQLWLSVEGDEIVAALTTSIVPRRYGLTLKMVCCGGSRLGLWKECHQQIEEFARVEGCDTVQIREGRPGWAKVLGENGYKVQRVTLEKRL